METFIEKAIAALQGGAEPERGARTPIGCKIGDVRCNRSNARIEADASEARLGFCYFVGVLLGGSVSVLGYGMAQVLILMGKKPR